MFVFAPSAAVAPAAPPAAAPLAAADSYNHNHTAPAAQTQAAGTAAATAPLSAPPLPVFPETLIGPGGAPVIAASALPVPPQQPPSTAPATQHVGLSAALLTPPTQLQLQAPNLTLPTSSFLPGQQVLLPATSAMLTCPGADHAQQPQQLRLTLPTSSFPPGQQQLLGGVSLADASALPAPPQQPPTGTQRADLFGSLPAPLTPLQLQASGILTNLNQMGQSAGQCGGPVFVTMLAVPPASTGPSAGPVTGHHLFQQQQQVAPKAGGAEGQQYQAQPRTTAPVPTPPTPLLPEMTVQAPPNEQLSQMTAACATSHPHDVGQSAACASEIQAKATQIPIDTSRLMVTTSLQATQPRIDTSRQMVSTSWGSGAGAGDRSPGSSGLGLSASDAPSSIPPSSLSLSTFSPNHASMFLSVGGSPGVLTLTSPPPQLVFDGPRQPTACDSVGGCGITPTQVQAGAVAVVDGRDVAHRPHGDAPAPAMLPSSPPPQPCPLIAIGGVQQWPLAAPAPGSRKHRFNQYASVDLSRASIPVMDTLTDVLGKAIEDVDPRVLLRRSRTLRKRIRVAWYHLMRPPQDLTPTERVKASRLPEFEAALARLDETARQLGLLPATEEAVLQEGARPPMPRRLTEEHSADAVGNCDGDDSSDGGEWDFGTLCRKFAQSAAHHLEKIRRIKQRCSELQVNVTHQS